MRHAFEVMKYLASILVLAIGFAGPCGAQAGGEISKILGAYRDAEILEPLLDSSGRAFSFRRVSLPLRFAVLDAHFEDLGASTVSGSIVRAFSDALNSVGIGSSIVGKNENYSFLAISFEPGAVMSMSDFATWSGRNRALVKSRWERFPANRTGYLLRYDRPACNRGSALNLEENETEKSVFANPVFEPKREIIFSEIWFRIEDWNGWQNFPSETPITDPAAYYRDALVSCISRTLIQAGTQEELKGLLPSVEPYSLSTLRTILILKAQDRIGVDRIANAGFLRAALSEVRAILKIEAPK